MREQYLTVRSIILFSPTFMFHEEDIYIPAIRLSSKPYRRLGALVFTTFTFLPQVYKYIFCRYFRPDNVNTQNFKTAHKTILNSEVTSKCRPITCSVIQYLISFNATSAFYIRKPEKSEDILKQQVHKPCATLWTQKYLTVQSTSCSS